MFVHRTWGTEVYVADRRAGEFVRLLRFVVANKAPRPGRDAVLCFNNCLKSQWAFRFFFLVVYKWYLLNPGLVAWPLGAVGRLGFSWLKSKSIKISGESLFFLSTTLRPGVKISPPSMWLFTELMSTDCDVADLRTGEFVRLLKCVVAHQWKQSNASRWDDLICFNSCLKSLRASFLAAFSEYF